MIFSAKFTILDEKSLSATSEDIWYTPPSPTELPSQEVRRAHVLSLLSSPVFTFKTAPNPPKVCVLFISDIRCLRYIVANGYSYILYLYLWLSDNTFEKKCILALGFSQRMGPSELSRHFNMGENKMSTTKSRSQQQHLGGK